MFKKKIHGYIYNIIDEIHDAIYIIIFLHIIR